MLYPLGEVELCVEIGGPVAFGVVVAQFGLQGESRQSEEALFGGWLTMAQHVLAQLVVIVLARYSIPETTHSPGFSQLKLGTVQRIDLVIYLMRR